MRIWITWSLFLMLPLSLPSIALADDPWTVEAGALLLHRSGGGSAPIIVDDLDSPVVDGEDYSFDMEAGFQIGSRLQCTPTTTLFGEYFDVDWDEALQRGATGLWVDGSPAFSARNSIARSLQTRAESNVQSATIGFEKQANDWLSYSIAYRYLSLDDSLWAEFSHGGLSDGIYRDTVDNDLNGVDVGITALLLARDRYTLKLGSGFGVYENDVKHWAYYNGGSGLTSYRETSDTTAWSYRLKLDGTYALTQQLSVGAGYRLLFVDDVANAIDQAPLTNFGGSRGTHDQSDVLFQGLSLFVQWVR